MLIDNPCFCKRMPISIKVPCTTLSGIILSSFMCHLLHSDKLGVDSIFTFSIELIMSSNFCNTSLLKYCYKISFADSGEAMSNYKSSSPTLTYNVITYIRA
ncbi:hypothetical protein L6164_033227 [Bauhinia variegata]|uniref:Uncharacterized protein n=1 Tax=Bauhinia variegata TaxID=167791 RepID=A0ACB9KR68_BAUVA|nr:hypothetical protein L6164_033227 [Bauhinia variegata]